MIKKADAQLIKLLNEIQILNIIREEGPISRIDLARRTQMSKVAVFEIINRLIDAGYVLDIGKGESTSRGGKRPTLVKLNPDHHFVIGIEFKRREAMIALATIEATMVKSSRLKYEVGTPFAEVYPKIFRKIDQLLKNYNISPYQLISIGIGIPGLIDYEHGSLRYADTLKGWGQIPITRPFIERYNVPTILENDVNTIALGESTLGAGHDEKNLVCIWIGEGVGAGLVVENQMIQGFGGGAGEIGYLELDKFCETGNKYHYLYRNQRYFGDILSESFLQKVLCREITKRTGSAPAHDSIEALLKSKHYVEFIKDVLDEYAEILGTLCLTIIKVVNPKLLVLSGRVVENSPYLVDRVRKVVKQNANDIPFFSSAIVVGELKEEAGISGAIALALQVIYVSSMASRDRKLSVQL